MTLLWTTLLTLWLLTLTYTHIKTTQQLHTLTTYTHTLLHNLDNNPHHPHPHQEH